jgi:RHS repeat-associated protein
LVRRLSAAVLDSAFLASGSEDVSQSVTYNYDSNGLDSTYAPQNTLGRLAAVRYGGPSLGNGYFTESYSYAAGGGVTGKRLQIYQNLANTLNGNTLYTPSYVNLDVSYSYDTEGRMQSVNYPTVAGMAGPSYLYTYDTMGRPSGLTQGSVTQVVSNVQYGLADELKQITYSAAAGPMTENRYYNAMFQMTGLTIGTGSSSGTNLLNISYNYSPTQNNGKITSSTDAISGEMVVYTYDTLNRLSQANANSTSNGAAVWGQSYTYDGFGNLSGKTPTQGSVTMPSVTFGVDPNHNQLTGYLNNGQQLTYDPNGNLTMDIAGNKYVYDVANRMTSFNSTIYYAYDPQNRRVWSSAGSDSNGNWNGTLYLYGVDGRKLGAYGIYVNQPGPNYPQSLAFTPGGGKLETYFAGKNIGIVADRLGSQRSGAGGYFPYGEDKGTPLANDQVKFATYTRDSATGLDYAGNRYYSSNLGRFTSPDPYVASGGAGGPQSWNRYAYASNDPVNFNDRRGLESCLVRAASAASGLIDDECGDDPFPPGGGSCGPGYYFDPSSNTCEPEPPEPDPGPAPQQDEWVILGNDAGRRPASEKDRTRDAIWAISGWTSLKTFSSNSKDCLGDLQRFGLTSQSVQDAASTTKLVNVSTLPQAYQGKFDPGADFTAIRNTTSSGDVYKFVVFNQSQFWQTTSSQVLGTLLHEIIHVSSAQNFSLTDQQIADKLGVRITANDDSAISLKLASDCFGGGGGR